MNFLIQFFVLLLTSITLAQDVNLKQVKCLVCRAIVDEFIDEVFKIDPKKKIEIGQYKMDHKGNTVQKQVPLSMSEVHLSDMLESICKKMDDYVRATYKSNGKLTLLKLMTENKQLNPLMSEVDIVQDGDLNKSLEYFCSDIVNENEDAFIEAILKREKNPKSKICVDEAGYCELFEDDSDDDINDETESSQADDYDLDSKDEL